MKTIRNVFLLALAGVLPAGLLFSQSGTSNKAPEFDHTTVYVQDLQKSADFYEKVIGLQKMPEPFKDGRHIWFRVGAHGQLHVVGGAPSVTPHQVDVHLAFRVASLPDFMAHLDKMQVKYGSYQGEDKTPTARPDGVKQIYLQDPEGYWIEVNDDKF